MKDLSDYVGIVIAVVAVVVQLLAKLRGAGDAAPEPKPERLKRAWPKKPQEPQGARAVEPDRAARARAAATAAAKWADEGRRKTRERIDPIDQFAAELAGAARVERPSRRFVDPDAFTIAAAPAPAGAIETDRQALLEAMVLREILGPPLALRGRPRRVRL